MTLPRRPFWRRFWLALAAVIAGNALYLGLLQVLPPAGRHKAFHIDLGLVFDFWLCLILYNILLLVFRSRQ